MSINCNPYLTFDGDCRQAMEFYTDVLKGTLEIMDFSEAPMEVPEELKSKVMHASIMFGEDAALMASDTMPGMGAPFTRGTNAHVSIQETDLAEAEQIFNALADGGIISMPFEKTFWGAKFGSCTDKFGTQWMVNCPM